MKYLPPLALPIIALVAVGATTVSCGGDATSPNESPVPPALAGAYVTDVEATAYALDAAAQALSEERLLTQLVERDGADSRAEHVDALESRRVRYASMARDLRAGKPPVELTLEPSGLAVFLWPKWVDPSGTESQERTETGAWFLEGRALWLQEDYAPWDKPVRFRATLEDKTIYVYEMYDGLVSVHVHVFRPHGDRNPSSPKEGGPDPSTVAGTYGQDEERTLAAYRAAAAAYADESLTGPACARGPEWEDLVKEMRSRLEARVEKGKAALGSDTTVLTFRADGTLVVEYENLDYDELGEESGAPKRIKEEGTWFLEGERLWTRGTQWCGPSGTNVHFRFRDGVIERIWEDDVLGTLLVDYVRSRK